ncbi:hypothetical protein K8I85_15290 [bacterium]|nr:hypothetical protein [bacterium]
MSASTIPGRLLALALLVPAATAATRAGAAEVTFRYRPDGEARTVTVAGTFNGWDNGKAPLADADGDGVWEGTLDVPAGRQSYKFVVNGSDWFTDETATSFEDDGFGGRNSVMEVGEEPMRVGYAGEGAPPPLDTRAAVTFAFEVAGRRVNAVSVAGSFNGQDAGAFALRDEDGDGTWTGQLRLDPGNYSYQFVIDGREWISCDASAPHEADGFGGRRATLTVADEPLTVRAGL